MTKDDYFITLDKKDIRNLKISLVYNGPIVAPVQKDDKVADLIVYNKNDIVKKLPLFAAEDLKKVNFFKSLVTSINYLIWEMFKKPFFIVFEGVEGCGKSYQSKRLFKKLKENNFKAILTREPGGTKSAELIRNLILKDYFSNSKKEKI